jgi:hypothetical protein
MTSIRFPCVLIFCLFTLPARAQSPASQPADPPIRRWLDVQTFTLYTRYRFTETSRDVTTTNQLQYKDSFRARFNIDPEKRYTVNFGYFSGNNFVGTWNNWGVGHGTDFDGHDNYMKQLYVSAEPVKGFTGEVGGLYLNRGDADEWTTYDEDGYLVGERATVKRPKQLYLDEITVTRAAIGPQNTPNLASRWDGFSNPNYTQVLGVKRVNPLVSGSFEYERLVGGDVFRAAITLHFDKRSPISTVRWQEYRRTNLHAAWGGAIWAEGKVTRFARVQGGYVSVDRFYGGWNADRMQSGRRVFVSAAIPIYGPIAASLYATQALDDTFTVPIARRFDAVISYDVLAQLRQAHIF